MSSDDRIPHRRLHVAIMTAFVLLGGAFAVLVSAGCGGGASSLQQAPAIRVSLSNAPTTVLAGATAHFTATVMNDSGSKGVTWSLTQAGSTCSPGCGTVAPGNTTSGSPTTFTAPSAVPTNSAVTITATSVADTSKSASAPFSIIAPTPVPLVNQPLAPDTAIPGSAFTLTVNGTGFVSASIVNWDGSALATTFVSSSQLTASVTSSDTTNPGTASVTVVSPGGRVSNEVFFPICPANCGGFPTSASTFPTGAGPTSVAVGDFNGDRKLDLVVGDTESGSVSILLGKGDGTFQSAIDYPVGPGGSNEFYEVAVADFNGDGKLDLAVSDYNGNDVSVLLGNGDGTFQTAVNYSAGTNPTSVAVADLNGDGNLDLVVSNQTCPGGACGTAVVSVLLGNGDGTFQSHLDYPAGVDANWVVAADFNRDGKLDLAVANGQSSCPGCQSGFSILLGNGDGTFQAPVTYYGATNPDSIATADFNGDGKLDLLLVDNLGLFFLITGNGDGTFNTNSAYGAYTGSFPFGSIGIGVFSSDGMLDIAIADSGANNVQFYDGLGNGTFSSSVYLGDTGTFPHGVAVADFNQDGKLDVAVPNYTDRTVSVLLQ